LIPGTGGPNPLEVDFGDLVRKLVLSEQVLLDSGVGGFALLVQKFGYDGVSELLRSGRVRPIVDWVTATQTGQLSVMDWRMKKGLLPFGSYSLAIVRQHDVKQRVHAELQEVNAVPGLRGKQAQKLRKLIAARIVSSTPERGQKGIQQAKDDMETNPAMLATAIAIGAREHFDLDIDPRSLAVRVEALDETDFRVETNIGQLLSLDEETGAWRSWASHATRRHGAIPSSHGLSRRAGTADGGEAGFRSSATRPGRAGGAVRTSGRVAGPAGRRPRSGGQRR
jgi:hypothetical protein